MHVLNTQNNRRSNFRIYDFALVHLRIVNSLVSFLLDIVKPYSPRWDATFRGSHDELLCLLGVFFIKSKDRKISQRPKYISNNLSIPES